MTAEQPDALELAEDFADWQTAKGRDHPATQEAHQKLSNELRRLHALNQELVEALRKCSAQLTRLGYSANHADAAIAKATGETK